MMNENDMSPVLRLCYRYGVKPTESRFDAMLPRVMELAWTPFVVRDLTDEELKEHPDWCWYLDCPLPEDGQEVLISSPYFGVYIDNFYNEGECGLDGGEEIRNDMAWMPLPPVYKGEVK